jgi:hypothetical protein
MKFIVHNYLEAKDHGPLEAEEVIELLYSGTLDWEDAIRDENSDEWHEMKQVFDIELLD